MTKHGDIGGRVGERCRYRQANLNKGQTMTPTNITEPNRPAVETTLGAIFMSLELSKSKLLITVMSPLSPGKMSKFQLPAGDTGNLLDRIRELQTRAKKQQNKSYSVIAIHEAGLDGFWVHRFLKNEGVESHVVDAASIATSRRRRRVKTDKIDGETLLRTLLAHKRGEPRVCSMVSPPSPDEEDRRRNSRERKTLIAERVKLVNRIKGLLYTQGVSSYKPLKRDRRVRLEELKTGDGRNMPPGLKAEILRILGRIELLLEQIKEVEVIRDSRIAQEKTAENGLSGAACLAQLRGVGPDFADTLWSEGLYRDFPNRRQLASYAGLTPTPWQSGSISRDQGVSKSGNPRLRTAMVQLSWFWLLHQPNSALSRWFKHRASLNGKVNKKSLIIALARKLLIALWKYVHHGVDIEGAIVKQAS